MDPMFVHWSIDQLSGPDAERCLGEVLDGFATASGYGRLIILPVDLKRYTEELANQLSPINERDRQCETLHEALHTIAKMHKQKEVPKESASFQQIGAPIQAVRAILHVAADDHQLRSTLTSSIELRSKT